MDLALNNLQSWYAIKPNQLTNQQISFRFSFYWRTTIDNGNPVKIQPN